MDNRWSLQKLLLQLGAPYKKSITYQKFEDAKPKCDSGSRFWDTSIGYVVKHENAKLRKPTTNKNQ